jgi:transcriptional regulator with XRE-family HTH domain
MKEKDAIVNFKEHQVVLFTEKEDETYGPTQTGSYISGKYLDDFREKKKKLDMQEAEKWKKAEISPIYYYMMVEEMTLSDLAARVGLSKRRVKKHFGNKYFLKMKIAHLKKYADVFNVPIANFFQIINTKQDHIWRSHFDENDKTLRLEQQETTNPLLVETNYTPEK